MDAKGRNYRYNNGRLFSYLSFVSAECSEDLSLSPSLSLSQKSTCERSSSFQPSQLCVLSRGVEGCRVLSQVEDATAAASLVGILEKGEVSEGAAAATCGRRNCLHLFSSPPPPVDTRLEKGSEDSAFSLTTPLLQWVHPSLSLCGEQKQFRLFPLANTKQHVVFAGKGFTSAITSTLISLRTS